MDAKAPMNDTTAANVCLKILFLEEVEKGLPVAVFRLGLDGPASLFLNQHLGLEKSTEIVGALIRNAYLDRLDALIARRRVKVQAVSTGMEISAAVLTLVSYVDFAVYLDFRRAIITAGNQMKTRLHASRGAAGPRRRFGFFLTLLIHVAALAIFSTHGLSSNEVFRRNNLGGFGPYNAI
jgi:hypothetical protein